MHLYRERGEGLPQIGEKSKLRQIFLFFGAASSPTQPPSWYLPKPLFVPTSLFYIFIYKERLR